MNYSHCRKANRFYLVLQTFRKGNILKWKVDKHKIKNWFSMFWRLSFHVCPLESTIESPRWPSAATARANAQVVCSGWLCLSAPRVVLKTHTVFLLLAQSALLQLRLSAFRMGVELSTLPAPFWATTRAFIEQCERSAPNVGRRLIVLQAPLKQSYIKQSPNLSWIGLERLQLSK